MRTNKHRRKMAKKIVLTGGWINRFILVCLLFGVITAFVQVQWGRAVSELGIQTWESFMLAKLDMMRSGLDLVVPSRLVARRMMMASAFAMFVSSILSGITVFGFCSLFLQAAKGVKERWMGTAMSGFRLPLSVAWLYFRYSLQISLWLMLFVVPGVIAALRYSQCWFLKAEHPEWSAGQCLSESCRLMDGHKRELLSYILCYWWLLPFVAIWWAAVGGSGQPSIPMLIVAMLCVYMLMACGLRLGVGVAMFHLEITEADAKARKPVEATPSDA